MSELGRLVSVRYLTVLPLITITPFAKKFTSVSRRTLSHTLSFAAAAWLILVKYQPFFTATFRPAQDSYEVVVPSQRVLDGWIIKGSFEAFDILLRWKFWFEGFGISSEGANIQGYQIKLGGWQLQWVYGARTVYIMFLVRKGNIFFRNMFTDRGR